MQDILADVKRDGAVVSSGKPFRIEYVGDMEMQVPGGYGAAPYYRYQGYCHQVLDIRQNDYLVNMLHIDPLTSQLVAWNDAANGVAMTLQVVNKPERFSSGRLEIKLDETRISGFS